MNSNNEKIKFSILTPTYNRANTLKQLYDSLKQNISDEYDIQWLIMDDGSTDDTKDVVENMMSSNCQGFEIKYFYQENCGKMNAINNLSSKVDGLFWIECDSDDYFTPNALKIIYDTYINLKDKNIDMSDLYAFIFLKFDQKMQPMGNIIPKYLENSKSKMFDLAYKQNADGEKVLVFFTKYRQKYLFELVDDEKFVTESSLYFRMDKDYSVYCTNIPIMICNYLPDGYSKNISKLFLNNPKGFVNYYKFILNDLDLNGIGFKKRISIISNYCYFAKLTNSKMYFNSFFDKFIGIVFYPIFILRYKLKNIK